MRIKQEHENIKNIANNHFSIQCICGHQALIAVSDVIAMRGEEMYIDDVELKARCTRCKSKGMFEQFQIIHVGNFHLARLGSEQNKNVGNG